MHTQTMQLLLEAAYGLISGISLALHGRGAILEFVLQFELKRLVRVL